MVGALLTVTCLISYELNFVPGKKKKKKVLSLFTLRR